MGARSQRLLWRVRDDGHLAELAGPSTVRAVPVEVARDLVHRQDHLTPGLPGDPVAADRLLETLWPKVASGVAELRDEILTRERVRADRAIAGIERRLRRARA